MNGLQQGILDGVIALLVLGLVIRRQMVERPLTTRRMLTMPLVLIVVGLASDATVFDHLNKPAAVILLVVGLLVGVAGGAARAATQQLSRRGGVVYTRGNRWTMLLWAATLLVRIGIAALGAVLHAPEGTGEALIFLAVTLAVQNVLLARRAGITLTGAPVIRPDSPAIRPETPTTGATGRSIFPED